MNRAYRFYDIIMATFVAVLLLSNIASAAKIIDWGVSLAGLPLAFDAGTLLFPISYILGDVLTEVYGYAAARRVIWVGFALSALMALAFFVIGRLPGEANWESAVGQSAFDSVLGGVSSGAIIAASLAAYFAGSFTNAVILARLKVRTQGRWLWLRTLSSTLVGEGVDTTVFVLIAAALGVFPWAAAASIIVANYIFKVTIEAAFIPVTYRVVSALKRAENVDHYDVDTNFNPFRMRV